ncbi:hypothetical protein BOTBODRAFT_104187, partial [Botryobasidium botryosum FD-172 SS1]
FRREVDIWKRLRHRHVLPLIGICTLPDGTYMISPWMQHGNIMSYLDNNEDVDCIRLLAQAAAGLEYLHAGSVVHGDVRGANILISESGDACVADFGLSMLGGETQIEYSLGSARWMAPELLVVEGSVRVTNTDVFSFGRLILEVLSGDKPFPNLGRHQVVFANVRGDTPERPTGEAAIARGLDDNMWALVRDCCHVEPDLRPTMSAVLSRLRAARP